MSFHNVLELVGVIVPLLSSLASLFNGKARAKAAAGECLTPTVAGVGAALNVGAMNFDKAMQLLKTVQAAIPAKPAEEEKPVE